MENILVLGVISSCVLIGTVQGIDLAKGNISINEPDATSKSKFLFFLMWIFRLSLIPLIFLAAMGDFLWYVPLFMAHYFKELVICFYGGILILLGACSLGNAIQDRKGILKSMMLITALVSMCIYCQYNVPQSIWTELSEVKTNGIILQSSSYSCVPAACANLMQSFGIDVTERQLAKAFRTSTSGTHLTTVIYILKEYGLIGSRNLTDVENMKNLENSIILVDHPETGPNSHAVYFMGYERDKFKIIDPMQGKIELGEQEFSKIWHGELVEFKFSAMQ